MNHEETREAIWHVCRSNDVPKLAHVIETQFTGRLKKSYGSAYYKKKTIFLSEFLFRNASQIKQYECLIHMACHFIVRYKWLKNELYQPFPRLHGPEWQEAMQRTNVPNTIAYCYCPASERVSRHVFYCACRKDLRFNEDLAQTVLGESHTCARCGSPVTHLKEETNGFFLPSRTGIATRASAAS
jgi:predicted SprT family Zn-dependent metalloprotease